MKIQLLKLLISALTLFAIADSGFCQDLRGDEYMSMYRFEIERDRNLTRSEINSLKLSLSKWIDENKNSDTLFEYSESYPLADIKACIPYNAASITQKDVQEGAIYYITTKCPTCGVSLVRMWFCSPDWTWEHLCGRAGDLIICPKCGRNSLKLHIMN